MSSKTMMWIAVFLGSLIGGWVAGLFGGGLLSVWGFVGSTLGAFAGIWFVWRFIGV